MSAVDLLVVGGGPGGAALAALAAAAGLRTTLLERERFPRDKVCGEFLAPEGCAVLGRLGLLGTLRDAGAAPIVRCSIADRLGRSVSAGLPDLAGAGRGALGISRERMDAAILDLARRRGVAVLERTEALGPAVDEGRVVGIRFRAVGARGDGEILRAPVTAAADGRRSAVQRALFPGAGDPGTSGPRSWFGLKTHFSGTAGATADRVELHLFDGGYAGLGAVEGGRINLALVVRAATLRAFGSPDALFRRRILASPAVAAALSSAHRSGPWKAVGPLRYNVRVPAAPGVLFVGDAAGTIDPFCGEGMSNALAAAELALPFVLEAARRGELPEAAASAYARAWRAAFEPVTRRVRRIGRLFERPRAAGATIALLRAAGSRRFMERLVAATRTGAIGAPSA